MQEVEQLINIYHTCFIVFLCLAILFLIATVVMFFVFKIPKIFDLRSGRGAKRTIQKMQEQNAQTGSLRTDAVVRTEKNPQSVRDVVTYPKTKEMYAAQDGGEQTTLLQQNAGEEQTTLLQQDAGEEQTTLLRQATEDLSQAEAAAARQSAAKEQSGANEQSAKPVGKFVIRKNIMIVHTDTII